MARQFIVPLAHNRQEQTALLAAMRETVRQRLPDAQLAAAPLASLATIQEGCTFWLEVGRPHPENDEVIMAIFHDPQQEAFLIFTPSQGVWQNLPLAVPAERVGETRAFRGTTL